MARPIFSRKIYDKMLAWKQERNGETALLINGARRVGKSTIVREFATKEYKSAIFIDFANVKQNVVELFNDTTDLDHIFMRLQLIYDVDLYPRESVIVFDEVQLCPKARQAIKYLVADGRYDYIETGSLLSIRRNTKDILIPSEETRLNMFPMDYDEFLSAINKSRLSQFFISTLQNGGHISDAESRDFMKDFRLYIIVGGMPQAVAKYIETNNISAVEQVKRQILELYIEDLKKIDPTNRAVTIFKSIPGELSKGKLKFEVGSVIDNVRLNQTEQQLSELEESMTVNFCYRCSDPNVGLGMHRDVSSFKIYLADTGLFLSLAFWDKEDTSREIYEKILTDKLSADLGYVFENVIAQIFRAAGHSLYYYTFPAREDGKNNYEVDFLLTSGNKLIPIEVKSSAYKVHKSLDEFCSKYSSRVAYPVLIYTKTIRKEQSTLLLPFYMASALANSKETRNNSRG
jgi:hypothetical protein